MSKSNLEAFSKSPWFIFGLYLVLIFIHALVYYNNEGMIKDLYTFWDSIYFSVVTITTLGYGDMLPVTPLGKFYVVLESLAGVILFGFFLIQVATKISDNKEKKRIDTLKLSFQEQYKIWRENTITSLVYLSGGDLTPDEKNKLYDNKNFREFFKKEDDKHWYEVMNNLSGNDYNSTSYKKDILHEIEFLQRNIETFIMQVPIENIDTINLLNRYINGLYKLKKYDLSESDELRSFMRILWALITSYDSNIGEYDKNYLFDAIDAI